ncbi:MAG: AfsR/SARP family transcriptional regulator [Christensenellales bacterium]
MNTNVHMLGRFEIIADGEDILQHLSGSKKGILLLEYLLLYTNKCTTIDDLYDILWPDNKISNPASSIKTLVSRLRNALARFNLNNLIVTSNGSYRWNTSMNISVDIFKFEALCAELDKVTELTEASRSMYEMLIQLYAGDLLPGAGLESWIVSKSVSYHNLYLNALHDYVVLLDQEKNYDDIIRVCRKGLETDALDSFLTMELMSALSNRNKNKDAMAQFHHTYDIYQSFAGTQPPNEVMKFYQNLIRIEQSSNTDIDTIREELTENTQISGPFICEYAILKDIFWVQARILSRLGTPIFLALISINSIKNEVFDPLLLDKVMKSLLDILKKTLRKGDSVSRYSPSQYAVLLLSVNYDTGRIALERVKKAFYQEQIHPDFVLNYKLKPIDIGR